MFEGQRREQLRFMYYESWRKHQAGLALLPLEAQIAALIVRHPEYQALLSDREQTLNAEFGPDDAQQNPFLHLGLHLAVQEQLATDRPPGVRALYQQLLARWGEHQAEHIAMECLGTCLWEAQRRQQLPDHAAYLACLRTQLARVTH
ncbi:DUF1841 family protein [Thiorhodospira sibirica]|uniref:DUF1841 family protein n=1 Tax=Thiorhodospira sibirica TaxID=154347 RepID=UPI00022C048F|nr:DUF1841 family protein [Thiorhodospira sibirica]